MIYYAERTAQQEIYTVIQKRSRRNNAADRLSVNAILKMFDITDHGIIKRWERILEEGVEGSAIEHHGRRRKEFTKKLPKEVGEDLLSEVQQLRAENDYLKNLQFNLFGEKETAPPCGCLNNFLSTFRGHFTMSESGF